jgi:hypothetical protein
VDVLDMPDEKMHVPDFEGGFEDMLSPILESEGAYSSLQLHFLRRLNRLLRLRKQQQGQLNEEGLRLIDRAIYSTYCDAVDLGVAAEAQKLLHTLTAPSSSDAQK